MYEKHQNHRPPNCFFEMGGIHDTSTFVTIVQIPMNNSVWW